MSGCTSLPVEKHVIFARKTSDSGRLEYPVKSDAAFTFEDAAPYVAKKIESFCTDGHEIIATGKFTKITSTIGTIGSGTLPYGYTEFKCK